MPMSPMSPMSPSPTSSSTSLSATYLDVDGPVHVAELGGPAGAPLALCVHGLAGSHAVWRSFAAELAATHRVLALDLPGHGRSPAAGRSASVKDAARLLEQVVERLGESVTLVGHSMGAAASVLAAATSQDAVEELWLLAPPMPRAGLGLFSPALLPHVALCAVPWLGHAALRRRVARRSVEEHVLDGLRLTCGSLEAVADLAPALVAEFEAARDIGEDPLASFIEAARSVGLLVAGARWYREAMAQVRAPVRVVQGALDRVLNPSGLDQLETLQPTWRTHLLPEVGHSPHMEAPAETVGALLDESAQPAEVAVPVARSA